jgi:hypothetical protein
MNPNREQDAPSKGLFEQTRRSVVDDLAQVTHEDQLASILTNIATSAATDLDTIRIPHDAHVQAHAVVATAKSWASIASFAITQFYVAGFRQRSTPSHQFGGWNTRVSSSLLHLSEILGQHLERARPTLGARSVSVSESFPSGLTVSVRW